MTGLGKNSRRTNRDSQGPGVPRGQVIEVRAVLLVALSILLGLGAWWGMQQMEKLAYLGDSKLGRISTAAGKQNRP